MLITGNNADKSSHLLCCFPKSPFFLKRYNNHAKNTAIDLSAVIDVVYNSFLQTKVL